MSFPLSRKFHRTNQPVTTVGSDQTTIVAQVTEAQTVTSVQYVPSASKAGAGSPNSRTLNLYNRGHGAGSTGGNGTTLIATLALVSGTDLWDNVPATLTLQTAANLVLASGDVLEFESLHITTGMSDPGGLVVVNTARVVVGS